MDPLHSLRAPIPSALAYQGELEEVQGNILRGHRRSFANHLLVRFDADAGRRKVGRVLGNLSEAVVSAWDQDLEVDKPFVGVGLSVAGYAFLGYRFPSYNLYSLTASDLALQATELPADEWKMLSAIVILASDSEPELLSLTVELVAELAGVGSVTIEHCAVVRDETTQQPIEHFGFVDGISQPCFFANECRPVRHRAADSAMGPYFALFPDPFGRDGHHDAGSFLVALKMEQNLREFRAQTRRLADVLGITRELAEAYVIGRFRDGTPLALSGRGGAPTDDFDYDHDPEGRRCPLAAHVRKMAPRVDESRIPAARESRIARRGMTYGAYVREDVPDGALPAGGRGLLFQCVQRDIRTQFKKLFANWANDSEFPERRSGRDALLNTGAGNQHWPDSWSAPGKTACSLRSFVRILGGEYFFLPSISFLRSLHRT
jgi:Dyp-type peroxidase family